MSDSAPLLDSFDRKLLMAIQADATLTAAALGEAIGLSANPTWRRLKRLEEEGFVTRRGVVDPRALGLRLTAFVSIRTARHDPRWLADFAAGIAAVPEIVECHRMTGDVDYMVRIVVRDIDHYDRVYQQLIARVPDMADVSAAFSMERLKQSTAIDLATID